MSESTAIPNDGFEFSKDGSGPAFDEPWQAQAFAMTLKLYEEGQFTWPEWAQQLGAEIAEKTALSGQTDNESYFQCWLAALEKISMRKKLVSPDQLNARKEQWRQAYLHTPHGKPVLLDAARAHKGR